MSASLNRFSLGNPASWRYLLSLLPRRAGHKGKTCHPAVMERGHLAPAAGLWSGWVMGLAALAAGHSPSLNPQWSDRSHGTSGPLLPWAAGPGVSVWRVITYRPWGVICTHLARSGVFCHCTSVRPVRKSPYLGILSCYALTMMFLWAGDAGGKWVLIFFSRTQPSFPSLSSPFQIFISWQITFPFSSCLVETLIVPPTKFFYLWHRLFDAKIGLDKFLMPPGSFQCLETFFLSKQNLKTTVSSKMSELIVYVERLLHYFS